MRMLRQLVCAIKPYAVLDRGSHSISLYNMDCVSGLEQVLQQRSVDVVVTSPPYNIGVAYSAYRDSLPREAYLDWIEQAGVAIKRVLADDGSLFLNVGNRPSDQWIALDVASRLRRHFSLQNVIHWIKSIAISKTDAGNYPNISGDIAVGHFKPVSSARFLNDCHEYIFHFTKNGTRKLDKLATGVPYQDKSNIGRWKKALADRRDRGNTWFIPYETIQDRASRPHPATFPVRLPEMCIRLHGQARLVADPFCGIGSTAVAADSISCSFVGFDIDKSYLDFAMARLSKTR